jgi:hypothetical protein
MQTLEMNGKEARSRVIEKKPPMAAISLGTDVDAPRGEKMEPSWNEVSFEKAAKKEAAMPKKEAAKKAAAMSKSCHVESCHAMPKIPRGV